jgi:hypothetical protein
MQCHEAGKTCTERQLPEGKGLFDSSLLELFAWI